MAKLRLLPQAADWREADRVAVGLMVGGRERWFVVTADGTCLEGDQSERGHVWLNWRDYLSEFAPLLFR